MSIISLFWYLELFIKPDSGPWVNQEEIVAL